jgi:hypothetical protein
MGINRFSKPQQLAGYDAMTFQELSVAPMQMRAREDRMMNDRDTILNELDNLDIHERYSGEAAEIRKQLKDRLNTLGDNIQKNGVGANNYMNEFRNLRNEYNTNVSKTGVLGMGVDLKKNIDAAKANFFKAGLQMKQPPKALEDAWNAKLDDYYSQLPETLSKHDGALPAFDPGIPPAHQDRIAYAAKLSSMIGNIEKTVGDIKVVPKYENGIPVDVEIYDVNNTDISNKEGIAKYKEFIKSQILNTASELRQDADFKGENIETVLNELFILADMGLTEVDRDDTNLVSAGNGGGTKTGKSKSGATGEYNGDTATLVKMEGSGKNTIPETSTLQDIKEQRKKIETGEIVYNDPDEKMAQLKALDFAAQYREAEINKLAQENPDEFAKQMTKQIQGNGILSQYGIRSYEDYQAIKQDPTKIAGIGVQGQGQAEHQMMPVEQKLAVIEGQMSQLKDTFTSELGDIRLSSDIYTLGYGAADDAARKTFTNYIKDNPMLVESMLSQNAISFINPGETGEHSFRVIDEPGKKESFKNILANAKDIHMVGMTSGNAVSNPTIMFEMVTNDEGAKRKFTLDLKDTEFTQNLLSEDQPFWRSMDPEGRARLSVMKDNITYRGLGSTLTPKNFSTKDNHENMDRNISRYARKANADIMKEVQNKEEPKGLEKILWDSVFIKPDDPNYSYNIGVNEDRSFSSYRINRNTGEVEEYTIGDYVDKRIAKGLIDYKAQGADIDETYLTSENGMATQKADVYNFFNTVISTAGDITTPENLKNSIVYNDSDAYHKAILEAHDVINSNMNLPAKREKVWGIYQKIRGKKLQSKRQHVVL